MEMSEEEILREAERIRARRGLRIARECASCGNSFLGNAQERYCSDACRMAAAREDTERAVPTPEHAYRVPAHRPGESEREYFTRIAGRPPTDEEEEMFAALDRIRAIWANATGTPENSLAIIHREREARLKQLTSQ